ncbi:putative peptidase C14 [Rosellinia necatrix]|uniref:Putative peptidase C14 n=1 Tax=Rosellinia necatrix TaxID=77044 RepID=A0A1S7UJV2_ROSNE|nr:putative peptidase C14 [Rosellinia necatrix]
MQCSTVGQPHGSNSATGDGVSLIQVYSPPASDAVSDVDVIAIHGLDTDSEHTWTWKHNDAEKEDVNWLKDLDMLPHRIPAARIFTCDWPARLFRNKNTVQMTIKELARSLLLGIQSRLGARPSRPILFIASCLGGIILIQAMDIAAQPGSGYGALWESTGGIVFLATPFRGTAFQDIAKVAVGILQVRASITGTAVTGLLDSLEDSTPFLQDLVASFTQICHRRINAQPCQLAVFYETEMSNLLRKGLPFRIADYFKTPKPLVDSSSARLDIVPNPIPLPRSHVIMNKFDGPDDLGYNAVSGQIQIMTYKILKARPVDQADVWIRNKYYSLKRLRIERLSGELLPMDRCYINLAILEGHSDSINESTTERANAGSSLPSLLARLKVETSQAGKEVTLPTLFEPRATHGDGHSRPSRIMIRGRAGVGKTTLCKKIVYEFTYHNLWRDLFDFVLWVPLRKLKLPERCQIPGYNFKHLFCHEYFSQSQESDKFAGALWEAIETKRNRALFILDGLDEVSRDLRGDMSDFLSTLLSQPNVIITSRPDAILPPNAGRLHLELETIGFYPAQVENYIQNSFTDLKTGKPDSAKIENVQSFLSHHELIRGLVRIPIQLDAFCYTWGGSDEADLSVKDARESMTAIYQGIEMALWRKDAERLGKWHTQTPNNEQAPNDAELRKSTDNERHLLELLAFNGVYNDIIDLEPEYRSAVFGIAEIDLPGPRKLDWRPFDDMLRRVSFLRSSVISSKPPIQNYHFLHLTFQEYFGALYFARQWKAQQPLKCLLLPSKESQKMRPAEFLGRHKYDTRYDIFWRFVAGLLDNSESPSFFQAIEEEPRDLLGFTHQRLIIHCLSEASPDMPLQNMLKHNLGQWILFESKFFDDSRLASELGFSALEGRLLRRHPGRRVSTSYLGVGYDQELSRDNLGEILTTCLESPSDRLYVLGMLQDRPLKDESLKVVVLCLQDKDRPVRQAALEALQGQLLKDEFLKAVVLCLQDKDRPVRQAALEALQGQLLKDEFLKAVVLCFQDKDGHIRRAALRTLQDRPLKDEFFEAVVLCLQDEDRLIRRAALRTLQDRPLKDEFLEAVVLCFQDEDRLIRQAALRTLQDRPLKDEFLEAVVLCFQDEDRPVRQAALEALQGRLLKDEFLEAVVLCLQDENEYVRKEALRTLKDQPLKDEFLNAILYWFRNEDWYAIWGARGALKDQPLMYVYLEARLDDKAPANVIEGLKLKVLQGGPLHQPDLDSVSMFLGGKHPIPKAILIEILMDQPRLHEQHITAIVTCLQDQDRLVTDNAIRALQYQENLPEKNIQAIVACLQHPDTSIKNNAMEVLREWPSLPEKYIQAIVACLQHPDRRIIYGATRVLQKWPSPPEKYIQAIVACLQHPDTSIKYNAMEVLEEWPSLPEKYIQAIVACLQDPDRRIIYGATRVLQKWPSPPEKYIQAIAACLQHPDDTVKWHAIDALQHLPNLPEKYIQAIAACLQNPNNTVKQVAIQAIQTRPNLPEEYIQAFICCLQPSRASGIAYSALEVLKGLPGLSHRHFRAIRIYFKTPADGTVAEVARYLLIRKALHLLPNQYIKAFYRHMLMVSRYSPVTWTVVNRTSFITIDGTTHSAACSKRFMANIRRAQRECGIPPYYITPAHSTLCSVMRSFRDNTWSRNLP